MSAARAQGGFSLLELLVVIVIIALGSALSVAWLAGADDSDRLRTAARQLVGEFRLAGEVARVRQRVIGWQPVDGGYRFVSWQEESGWQPWRETRELTPTQWPLPVTAVRQPPPGADTALPWLIWLPDGEVMGARLLLHSGSARQALEVDGLGARLTNAGST
ncbi:GspH/FimT family pseudopilin [Kushneria aurantia]|uniref:Type II secretion system protein H n=1 Tax=Kushneria aurantia TaxID=504092 RepID=A0ABV6G5G3_9GAMM|nr:GspH/FimT family pseudopilin [Kushneria aurantia]